MRCRRRVLPTPDAGRSNTVRPGPLCRVRSDHFPATSSAAAAKHSACVRGAAVVHRQLLARTDCTQAVDLDRVPPASEETIGFAAVVQETEDGPATAIESALSGQFDKIDPLALLHTTEQRLQGHDLSAQGAETLPRRELTQGKDTAPVYATATCLHTQILLLRSISHSARFNPTPTEGQARTRLCGRAPGDIIRVPIFYLYCIFYNHNIA